MRAFIAYTLFIFALGWMAHAVFLLWLDSRRASRSDIAIARGKRKAKLDLARAIARNRSGATPNRRWPS